MTNVTTDQTPASQKNWKNVNNWHWVEKNCLPWARDYLTREFQQLSAPVVVGDGGSSKHVVRIASVRSVDGDVDVNVRKGKVIYLFDLKCVATWQAVDMDGNEVATGDITLTDCTFDETPDTYGTNITLDGADTPEKLSLKQAVATHLRPLFNPVFVQFPIALVNEQGPALLVEASGNKPAVGNNNGDVGKASGATSVPSKTAASTGAASSSSQKSESAGVGRTSKVTVHSEFKASAEDVYESLLDEGRVAIWTGDRNCVCKKEAGSKFSLMNHSITGELESLEPNKMIVMKWRLRSWPAGHLSTVTIKLMQETDCTKLEMSQTGVPHSEEETVRQNWENIYFNRIKHIFGYAM